MKSKIYCLILSLILISPMARAADITLKCRPDGTFKVLAISDTHFKPSGDPEGVLRIETLIDTEDPDLVIVNGDCVSGATAYTEADLRLAISYVAQAMEERQVPWAVTYGNHADDIAVIQSGGVTMTEMMGIYEEYPFNVNSGWETGIHGIGNKNLPVWDNAETEPVCCVWLLDSGWDPAYEAAYGYDYIRPDQIAWYVQTSTDLETQYGHKIPGLMFFHIPLQQSRVMRLSYGIYDGDWNEEECPSRYESGMFDALKSRRDVGGVFNGHDHVNNYAGLWQGILLGYGSAAGSTTYDITNIAPSYQRTRGGRVFLIDETDPMRFQTWMRFRDNSAGPVFEYQGGAVIITSPTSTGMYSSSSRLLSIAGTAEACEGETVTSVSWSNSLGGSGSCSGTTNWSASGIPLKPGRNVITVTAEDSGGHHPTATLPVVYNPPASAWIATVLPSTTDEERAYGLSNGRAGGYINGDSTGNNDHAALWTGPSFDFEDLHPAGYDYSRLNSVCGDYQVGYFGGTATGYQDHAGLWNGSLFMIDLNPPGAYSSCADAISDNYQVGYVSAPETGGAMHACIWMGTPGYYLDLNPSWATSSHAYGIEGGYQVGYAYPGSYKYACLWSFRPKGCVNLNPAGYAGSEAKGVYDYQQVGHVMTSSTSTPSYACSWYGNSGSFTNLHPTGYTYSKARDVCGGLIAGYANQSYYHAGVWGGTAGSFADLGSVLPAEYTTSFGSEISADGGVITVAGSAQDQSGNIRAVVWTCDPSHTRVQFTWPTTEDTYYTTEHCFRFGGGASPIAGASIVSVTWSNDRGGSGVCGGTNPWSVPTSIVLQSGENVITVTATDSLGSHATDTLIVTFDAPDVYGNISLQNYVSNLSGINIAVELRSQGGSTTPRNVTLESDGSYCLPEVSSGTYNIAFKGSHWLRKVVPDILVREDIGDVYGVDASLINGDCNNDNMISAADLIIVRKAYGTTPGSSKWDARADLNGDGMVSAADLIIVRKNYGKIGDS